jgi:transposase
MSVPGVGPIISSAVVAAIGTGAGFKQGRDFGAWLGLVPRQESTGDRTTLGKISKRGNKDLRTLFVQAAHVVLVRRPHGAKLGLWPWIEAAGRRLHRNMLVIALANKLARIAWRCWPVDTPISRGAPLMRGEMRALQSLALTISPEETTMKSMISSAVVPPRSAR